MLFFFTEVTDIDFDYSFKSIFQNQQQEYNSEQKRKTALLSHQRGLNALQREKERRQIEKETKVFKKVSILKNREYENERAKSIAKKAAKQIKCNKPNM